MRCKRAYRHQCPEMLIQSAANSNLMKLDTTLKNLIATLPANPSLISSQRAAPNHTVQKNTPLPLRRALQQTRLSRAKKQAEEDRQSGAVRAKTKHGDGPALNQKFKRMESGEEERRRRGAHGIGGLIGRVSGKTGMLHLSRDEIRKGNNEPLPSMKNKSGGKSKSAKGGSKGKSGGGKKRKR